MVPMRLTRAPTSSSGLTRRTRSSGTMPSQSAGTRRPGRFCEDGNRKYSIGHEPPPRQTGGHRTEFPTRDQCVAPKLGSIGNGCYLPQSADGHGNDRRGAQFADNLRRRSAISASSEFSGCRCGSTIRPRKRKRRDTGLDPDLRLAIPSNAWMRRKPDPESKLPVRSRK